MGSRPRLKPDFRPLRRGREAVQLGRSAAAGGIILAGLAPAEIALLDRLDGSLPEEDLYAAAVSAGVDRDRAGELLGLLRTHRVLLAEAGPDGGPAGGPDDGDVDGGADAGHPGDPPAAPGRWPPLTTARRVVVDGSGPLPAAVAGLLRAGGLRRVEAGPWAADLADAELRDTETHDPGSRDPGSRETGSRDTEPWDSRPAVRPASGGAGLIVLVGRGGVDPRAGEPWRRRGIPVLPVVVDGERIVVGPVVVADPALPCLRCLQLSRIDRDAAWLDVLAQAADHGGRRGEVTGAPPDVPRPDVVSLAAGVVAMVARAALGDVPVPAGVSVEVASPWPRLDHRRWTRHPACPAHGPRSVLGPGEGPGPDPDRLG